MCRKFLLLPNFKQVLLKGFATARKNVRLRVIVNPEFDLLPDEFDDSGHEDALITNMEDQTDTAAEELRGELEVVQRVLGPYEIKLGNLRFRGTDGEGDFCSGGEVDMMSWMSLTILMVCNVGLKDPLLR
ncbi:hypothetical protein DUNSADRAFT_2478 [Dunaliella salina]|uniref:Encoded protein n=1 Tax=Dunaliella salina TaxID=3046 RepID=A0ABQ7GVK5_DUNSA|nr:hypothetical protein DUNSADRAFT_2478 [Dunaliella salina]|eukprot:KAF5838643.1 hypothetical protein DUNSADRAFT_2478 [Dunaliella salina]